MAILNNDGANAEGCRGTKDRPLIMGIADLVENCNYSAAGRVFGENCLKIGIRQGLAKQRDSLMNCARW